jgi:transposase InsO family protein
VEFFGSRVRDELLGVELFETLTEAQVLVADWREDYNHNRPHSALGMTAPARFVRTWRADQIALAADTTTLQSETNHRLSHHVDR